MTSTAVKALPARYAKFLTSLAGQAVVYLQLYGTTWHLVPAVTMIAAALGVMAVPNAPKPGVITPGIAYAYNPPGNPPERVVLPQATP